MNLDAVSSALSVLDADLRNRDELRKRLAAGDVQGAEIVLRRIEPWTVPAVVYTALNALRSVDRLLMYSAPVPELRNFTTPTTDSTTSPSKTC